MTYNTETQLWDNSALSVYFCKDFLVNPNENQNKNKNNENYNNLTINIDYDNLLKITNVTNFDSNSENIVYMNEIVSDHYDGVLSLFIADGCYEVTFMMIRVIIMIMIQYFLRII